MQRTQDVPTCDELWINNEYERKCKTNSPSQFMQL